MKKELYSKTLHHAKELYAIVHNNEMSQELRLTREHRLQLSDMLSELAISTQILEEEYEEANYHG